MRRVIVVDNASEDQSLGDCRGSDLPIETIRNVTNLGFARACNQGARLGDADYVLFLNPDVRLSPTSLAAPIAFLERNRHAAICGIRLTDANGEVSTACARLPRPARLLHQIVGLDKLCPRLFSPRFMSTAELEHSGPVEQVSGACFFVRRQVYESLHGFDERFFMYYEEVDFSLRASSLGHSSYYLGTATATHLGGVCSGRVKGRRLFYALRSRLAFAMKHFPRPAFLCILCATLALEPWTRLAWACVRGSFAEVKHTVEAYKFLYSDLIKSRPAAIVRNGRI